MYEGWVHDFMAFFSHVGPRPTPKHTLDRIDNNRGYAPLNLRWGTWSEQLKNRRPFRPRGAKKKRPPSDRTTNFKHGMVLLREYKIWSAMKNRCLNPKNSNYSDYGGRGIKIYEPWIHYFQAFYEYLGPRPTPQHSLDRYPDNDGNYEPGNVRWATKLEQTQNRRPCKTGPTHGNFDHGGVGTPEYKTWGSAKNRCFNPKNDRYPDYGGAGTTMCQGWRDNFPIFLKDLGKKPSPEHTLMRLDPSGHYSCGRCGECLAEGWLPNCRWGTKTEQNRNRRPSARSGKLTPEKVQAIRDRLLAGSHYKQVAKEFEIGVSLVGKIKRRENWA